MVVENIGETLLLFISLSATFAAVMGIIVLGGFFHNKLKELFSDANYFVFFFLVAGYILYALGEVSFYLTKIVFGSTGVVGIQDAYWSAGAVLILLSFLALTLMVYRQNHGSRKALPHLLIGGLIIVLVLMVVFGSGARKEEYFFGTFYPLVSSLIVATAFSTILFSRQLGGFGRVLVLFFFASSGILLGDVFFYFATAQATYGTAALVADVCYLFGYLLSGIAFLTMRLRMHSLAFRR